MSSPEQMAAATQLSRDCIGLAADTGNACYTVTNRTVLHGFSAMVIARTCQSLASASRLAQDGMIGDALWCGRTVVEFAIDLSVDLLAELERRRAAFRANNRGAMSTWSGEQVEARAAAGSRLPQFELSYRDQSNAGHSGPGALDYAMVKVDGEWRVRFGALEPQIHPIILAVTGMCVLIDDIVKACGLDEELGRRSSGIGARVPALVDADRTRA